jgi:hypothetical protein
MASRVWCEYVYVYVLEYLLVIQIYWKWVSCDDGLILQNKQEKEDGCNWQLEMWWLQETHILQYTTVSYSFRFSAVSLSTIIRYWL